MIEWKGLYANTPYSSANNKTQDDAVVGMQDTIYVTGPGYGGYSANVRVHNASGAVVALIPVSGGGGALSAPAPVRILDDSTTYSYSLEVVRGAVPSDDADKIIIRIVGGAAKRFPGAGVNLLPDGSTSIAGPLRVAGGVVAGGNAATRRSAPIARWEAHPVRSEDNVSPTTNATCQINILAPIKEWTHIVVELENKAATEYTGLKNIIAALTDTLDNANPSVGGDVTGNPRTGWVSVAADPAVPARHGTVEEGSGYWKSGKIFLPSQYLGAPTQRNKIVCLRYWLSTAGSTYKFLTTGGAQTPPELFTQDELGNLCWAKRITGRTTNADCVAGTSAAGGDALNAGTNFGTSTQIMRVYFYNGTAPVGASGRAISVEICGASTVSQQGLDSSGGRPWIGLANAALRPVGITLGYAGRAGSTTAQYLAAAKARLDSAVGQYALYPVFAGNDTDAYLEATSVLQVQRFFEFAEYAISKNIVPIGLILCHPVGAVGSDGYIARDNSIGILEKSGYALIDARQWIGQPAALNLMQTALTLDGVHLNPTGDAVMAAAFPGALEAVITAYPPMK